VQDFALHPIDLLAFGLGRRLAVQRGAERRPSRADHAPDAVGEDRRRPFERLARFPAVEPFTVALGRPIAQQEHRQPLVEVAPLADLLAAVKDRHRHAVDRPRQRRIGEPHDGGVHRRVPRHAEGLRIAPPAQGVGGGAAHADRARRFVDAAAIGQPLDERELLVRRPAVVAIAHPDGHEIELG
jgi:hypothetical protein